MPEQSTSIALPLAGKRILVTRTREQASVLSERLAALGAIPIEFPTIRIVPPVDWGELDAVLGRLFDISPTPLPRIPARGPSSFPECGFRTMDGRFVHGTDTPRGYPEGAGARTEGEDGGYYSWLIFTSANAVTICCERLLALGYDLVAMREVRIATIGPATAAALTRYGLRADLIPDEYRAEGVASAILEDFQLRDEAIAGKRILLPRAAEARKILVTELQQAGAIVDEVPAYYTQAVASDDIQGQAVLRRLQNGEIDILTFTSSSTVRNFMQWLVGCEEQGIGDVTRLVTHNPQLRIACIGPITSETAQKCGLTVAIEATAFTIDGLIEALVRASKE